MSFTVLVCTKMGLLWTILGSCLASSNVRHFKYRRVSNTADMCLEKTLPTVSLLRCAAKCARVSCRSFVYKLEEQKCTPFEGSTKQRCSMAAAPVWKLLTKKQNEKPGSASHKASSTNGSKKVAKKSKSRKLSKNAKAGSTSNKATATKGKRKAAKKPKRGRTSNQQRLRKRPNSFPSPFKRRRRPKASHPRSSQDDSACRPIPQPARKPKGQRDMCMMIKQMRKKNASQIQINKDSLPLYLSDVDKDGFQRHQFMIFYPEMLFVKLPRIASRHIKYIVIDYKHNSDGAVYWLTSGGRYDCLYSSALKSHIVERNGSSCMMLQYGEAQAALKIRSGLMDSFIVDGEEFGLLGSAGFKRATREGKMGNLVPFMGDKIGPSFAVNRRTMFFVRKYRHNIYLGKYGFDRGSSDNWFMGKITVKSISVDADGKYIYLCTPTLKMHRWEYRAKQTSNERCKQVAVRGEILAIITEKNRLLVLSSNTFEILARFKTPKSSSQTKWSLK